MSLIVCCFVPTGIVISGDSRTTGFRTIQVPQWTSSDPNATIDVPSPGFSPTMLERFTPYVTPSPLASWGGAFVNDMPIAHYIEECESSLYDPEKGTTESVADKLWDFFHGLEPQLDTGFALAGYVGLATHVFSLWVKGRIKGRINVDPASGNVSYSILWRRH